MRLPLLACLRLGILWCAGAVLTASLLPSRLEAQVSTDVPPQVYVLQHRPAAELERALGEALTAAGLPHRLMVDPVQNRLLVWGPDMAQSLAEHFLTAADRPPSEPAPAPVNAPLPANPPMPVIAPGPTNPGMPAAPAAPGEQVKSLRLGQVRTEQVEGLLRQWLGPRLTATGSTPGRPDYVYTDASGRRVEIFVDRSNNALGFRGPDVLVLQFQRLVQSIDQPAAEPGKAQRIMPFKSADPAKVQEAVRAYRQGSTRPDPGDSGAAGGVERLPNGQVDLVSYLFQASEPAAGAPPLGQAPPAGSKGAGSKSSSAGRYRSKGTGIDRPAGDNAAGGAIPAQAPLDEATRRQLRALGAEVEVEVLPDLDVVILRGREQDVDDVARIVQELERISVEAQPTIEVLPLKNVGSEALTALLAKVSDAVVGGRQGRVSVTPLVSPNSLLLIGWGDALTAMHELIEKLDQPVAPDTQFQVFPLHHAPVNTLAGTVQQHFTGRAGLTGRLVITPDARTNTLIVQAPPKEMGEVAALVEGLDRDQSAAVNQTRLFRLTHSMAVDMAATLQSAIDVARSSMPTMPGAAPPSSSSASQKSAILELITLDPQGQKIIKSGILADVRITPDPRLNTLLVTGPAESMDLIAALIGQLDQPVSAAQIKVFRIVNGDATNLVTMLRALLFRTDTSGGPQLSVNPTDESLAPLRFSVDVRTNSIVAVGSVGDLRIIEALMLRLDEQEMQRRKVVVYRLKNAPALDVATAVNEFLRSKRQVAQALPGVISPYEQIESEVIVVPETVSNALILGASPRFFDEVSQVIEQLDAQPPQVLIQVLIAQVNLDNFNEFGMELGLQDSLLFDRSVLGNVISVTETTTQTLTGLSSTSNTRQDVLSANLTPGFNFNNQPLGNSGVNSVLSNGTVPSALAGAKNVAGQGLSNFNVGRTNSDLGYGGLVLSASSESVSMLLRALQQSSCLEVLSRPQVTTLDNQPAFIQVGQRVPRVTGTAVNQFGQVNNIVLENVGLILQVTPRISPEGMVVMEIDAEKSEVDKDPSDGVQVTVSNNTPVYSQPINVTTAQTTVSAHSGETVLLGGLITKSTQNIDRRVPLLGDIPILGELFHYASHSKQRSELLIVLTPHVIRSPEDMERAKQLETSRMHVCLRDVSALHGDIGAGNNDVPANAGGAVIYPDSNPRGLVPSAPPDSRRLETIPEMLPSPPGPQSELRYPSLDEKAGTRRLPWDTTWSPEGTPREQFNSVVPAQYAQPAKKE